MAVPKRKTSVSRRNMRRSQKKLQRTNYVVDGHTGELTLPHRMSLDGYYKGRQLFPPKEKSADSESAAE